ncbi:hypothetical protein ACFW04_010703 [Cataglyphis niger]
MASYIMNITVMCFLLKISLTEIRETISLFQWFGISYWTMSFIVRLYVIHYICEYVKDKAKQIDKIFHQLTNIIRYADIWKEINQFILQAMQHPLKFTGMGLFYFGNDFLRKFAILDDHVNYYRTSLAPFSCYILYYGIQRLSYKTIKI